MQLNTFIVMNNGCSFYSSVFLISLLVLIIGKMLWLQRTIPFTEGQLEREIIVKMIRSGELPLLDTRIAQEPKILHARINLPKEYRMAARKNSIHVVQTDKFWEIRFLNHVSLFGENHTYYVYHSDASLNQRSQLRAEDFTFCGPPPLYKAERLAPYWYYVACPW